MDEKFGEFVRNKREEKKINLRKLAEILEIAPAYEIETDIIDSEEDSNEENMDESMEE